MTLSVDQYVQCTHYLECQWLNSYREARPILPSVFTFSRPRQFLLRTVVWEFSLAMFFCRSGRIICCRLSHRLPTESNSSGLQYVLFFWLISACIMHSIYVGRFLSASPDARFCVLNWILSWVAPFALSTSLCKCHCRGVLSRLLCPAKFPHLNNSMDLGEVGWGDVD
jgi:hypothetical protein